jgi:diphosphomevalonate decarboxylase
MKPIKIQAPVNIALIKYWGKSDEIRVLPTTTSLSLTLTDLYTETTFSPGPFSFTLNGKPGDDNEVQRVKDVLQHFAHNQVQIDSVNNFPTASGLASSASGFAALTYGLNEFFQAQYSLNELATLTRIGSGSSCRSLVDGFAIWHQSGALTNRSNPFKNLMMLIVIISETKKPISSREAMKITKATSSQYASWMEQSEKDYQQMMQAIDQVNFQTLGDITERNSTRLHQLMATAEPSIVYQRDESRHVLEVVREARKQGLLGYATMDAGPNVKILISGDQLVEWEKLIKVQVKQRYLLSRIGGCVHVS